jgi:hypothetical protein
MNETTIVTAFPFAVYLVSQGVLPFDVRQIGGGPFPRAEYTFSAAAVAQHQPNYRRISRLLTIPAARSSHTAKEISTNDPARD